MNKIFRIAKLVAPTLVLAVLLYMVIDGMQVYADSAFWSFWILFGPPAVGIGILVSAVLPVSKYTRRIVQVGRIVLPPFMIISAWRILEYIQTYVDCNDVSGGPHEFFCVTVGLQVFAWAPFLMISALIVLMLRLKRHQFLPLPTDS